MNSSDLSIYGAREPLNLTNNLHMEIANSLQQSIILKEMQAFHTTMYKCGNSWNST
jgi:hypothetical protein